MDFTPGGVGFRPWTGLDILPCAIPTEVASMRRIHTLGDLEPGLRFVTDSYELTLAEIFEFARKYDPQAFHLDTAVADAHPVFQGLAASGWHTASITMRLLTTSGPRLAGGVIGLGGDVTWPRPARPGNRLTVHGEVTERRASKSRPDRGIVTMRCETLTGAGDVVQILTARLMVFTAEPAAPA
jgi:acyl dehydratase